MCGCSRLALACQRSYLMPFIFEAAQEAGIDLVLIHDVSEAPPPPGLPAVTDVWSLPVFEDPDAALDEFSRMARSKGIGGIMTLREEAVIWVARAAQAIGTPGIPVDVARLARNKYRMRTAFARAALRTPGFARVASPRERAVVDEIGYPVVVKPLAGWGSAGVMLARDGDELEQMVDAVLQVQCRDLEKYYQGQGDQGLVVERYLEGTEHVVECFVDSQGVHVMAVGDKGRPVGPWFEETIYRLRDDVDSAVVASLCEAAVAGVKALGITQGPAHVEMRLDQDGMPFILEIGARIGGSGVSHFIVQQGTGVSFAALCMKAALGLDTPRLPDIVPVRKVSANYIIPLRGSGVFKGFRGMEHVKAHGSTKCVISFFDVGRQVPEPPAFGGYPGFVFSVHDSQASAREYHQWLDEVLSNVWEKRVPAEMHKGP